MLKKVCRQLGVFKWPYKETKLIARRQGRVIAASAPIPADLRGINAAVASSSTTPRAPSAPASVSTGKRKGAPSKVRLAGMDDERDAPSASRRGAPKRQRVSAATAVETSRSSTSRSSACSGSRSSPEPPRARRVTNSCRPEQVPEDRADHDCADRKVPAQEVHSQGTAHGAIEFEDSSSSSRDEEQSMPDAEEVREEVGEGDGEDADGAQEEAEEDFGQEARLDVDEVDGDGREAVLVEASDLDEGSIAGLWQVGELHVRHDNDDVDTSHDTTPGMLEATGPDREHDLADEHDLDDTAHAFGIRDRSRGLEDALYGEYQLPSAARHPYGLHMPMEDRGGARFAAGIQGEIAEPRLARGPPPGKYPGAVRGMGVGGASDHKHGGRGGLMHEVWDMRFSRGVDMHGGSGISPGGSIQRPVR